MPTRARAAARSRCAELCSARPFHVHSGTRVPRCMRKRARCAIFTSLCVRWRRLALRQRCCEGPTPCRPASKSVGFHQQRLKATNLTEKLRPVSVEVSTATATHELKAAALLRAQSFYVYPPDRQFAGALTGQNSHPIPVRVLDQRH